MSRNGSGGYSLPSNSWNPAVNGSAATSADWNSTASDIAAAIQQSVSSDGQTPMTGNLNLNGNKITNLANASASGDAVSLGRLDETDGAALIGYLPAGTGAVATTVQAKQRECVSVKDFGAVGDGVTDDTAAINLAIVYVGTRGGGSVYAPAGTYMVSSLTDAIKINYDNVRLYGDGIGITTFKNLAASKATIIHAYKGTYPGGLAPIKNVTIDNLTVDGNQANIVHYATDTYQNGINFDYGQNCVVHHCEAKNVVFQGIVMQGSGDGLSRNCKVHACDVSACGEFGIGIEGGMWKTIVSNNTIHDLITVPEIAGGGVGIYVGQNGQTGRNNTVVGNMVTNTPSHGILVGDGSAYTIVTGNNISNAGQTAGAAISTQFNTVSSSHIQIVGNRISNGCNSGSSAIQVLNSSTAVGFCSVMNNSIADSLGGAIQVNSGTGATISGNTIASTGTGAGSITSGIRLSGSAVNTEVSGNTINTTAGNGVEVLSGCTGTAVRSTNRFIAISGSTVSDAGTSTVIEGIIVSYTPVWTSSSAPQPALGNGALSGRYVRVGNIVHLNVQLTIGTTTTVGTNVWQFSLPIPPVSTPFNYQTGTAYILDSGTAEYSCVARIDATNGVRVYTGASPSAAVGSATPHAWASTDIISIQVSYEV